MLPVPRQRRALSLLLLTFASSALRAQQPVAGTRPGATAACSLGNAAPTESVALVLSGGGAHGIAHIGVLEVLDSLGIRPSLVVGTSIGVALSSGREEDIQVLLSRGGHPFTAVAAVRRR